MLKKRLRFLLDMRHARVGTLEDEEVQDMALVPLQAGPETGHIQQLRIR